jgi:hypothetical protein
MRWEINSTGVAPQVNLIPRRTNLTGRRQDLCKFFEPDEGNGQR